MRVVDLFPLCQSETCPLRGQHRHPLPHQLALIESSEKYVVLKGGYGSAKTLAACILGVLLSLNIAGNRGFVGRRTYSKLNDSTLKTFMEVLGRAQEQFGLEWKERENRDGFPHRIIFPNDSEVVFRETKDIGRFLGPEYGWFYIDEAAEEPESTFTGLMGRLRLPHAGQYLKGILTTNPPTEQHWIAKRFGLEDGVIEYVEPTTQIKSTYRLISSSTRDNPHLPPGYLADLLVGLTPAEVKRVVEGNYGFSPEGPPVYPTFRHELHVNVPALAPAPLIRAWDFGFRHPAVTWHQLWTCRRANKPHWSILHETNVEKLEAEELAKVVVAETKLIFPDVSPSLLLDCGDTAGAAVSDKGPGPIIRLARPPYGLRFRHRKIAKIAPGVELINKLLRQRCECGLPTVIVHRRAKNVIDGFAGGYHRPKNRPTDDPVKDGFYDDYMDSVRYAAENFVRAHFADTSALDEMAAMNQPRTTAQPSSWAWMGGEPTPEQVAAEIARVKELTKR